jgi:hypothetical protein
VVEGHALSPQHIHAGSPAMFTLRAVHFPSKIPIKAPGGRRGLLASIPTCGNNSINSNQQSINNQHQSTINTKQQSINEQSNNIYNVYNNAINNNIYNVYNNAINNNLYNNAIHNNNVYNNAINNYNKQQSTTTREDDPPRHEIIHQQVTDPSKM